MNHKFKAGTFLERAVPTKIHGDISMKKTAAIVLVLMLLIGWVPGVCAEIYQELDPMVPVDSQATASEETSANGAVSDADAASVDKKVEETDKDKSKKLSKKKSSEKKKKKSSFQSSRKRKKNSR